MEEANRSGRCGVLLCRCTASCVGTAKRRSPIQWITLQFVISPPCAPRHRVNFFHLAILLHMLHQIKINPRIMWGGKCHPRWRTMLISTPSTAQWVATHALCGIRKEYHNNNTRNIRNDLGVIVPKRAVSEALVTSQVGRSTQMHYGQIPVWWRNYPAWVWTDTSSLASLTSRLWNEREIANQPHSGGENTRSESWKSSF